VSEFRRRLLIRNANKGGIKLPTYDESTYPYTALLKGTFISAVTESTGITNGYSFTCCSIKHNEFVKEGEIPMYKWRFGSGAWASTSITFVSADGITWQQYGGVAKQFAYSWISTLEETIYDNILSA
jgi:hypothetical protein